MKPLLFLILCSFPFTSGAIPNNEVEGQPRQRSTTTSSKDTKTKDKDSDGPSISPQDFIKLLDSIKNYKQTSDVEKAVAISSDFYTANDKITATLKEQGDDTLKQATQNKVAVQTESTKALLKLLEDAYKASGDVLVIQKKASEGFQGAIDSATALMKAEKAQEKVCKDGISNALAIVPQVGATCKNLENDDDKNYCQSETDACSQKMNSDSVFFSNYLITRNKKGGSKELFQSVSAIADDISTNFPASSQVCNKYAVQASDAENAGNCVEKVKKDEVNESYLSDAKVDIKKLGLNIDIDSMMFIPEKRTGVWAKLKAIADEKIKETETSMADIKSNIAKIKQLDPLGGTVTGGASATDVCNVENITTLKECAKKISTVGTINLTADISCSGTDCCSENNGALIAFDNVSNKTIQGNNHTITRHGSETVCPALQITNSSKVTVVGLTFDEDAKVPPCTPTQNCADAISIRGSNQVTLERVNLYNAKAFGIGVNSTNGITLNNSIISNIGIIGFYAGDNSSKVSVTNSTFTKIKTNAVALQGVIGNAQGDNIIQNNKFIDNHYQGQWLAPNGGRINGGQIYIPNASYVTVSGNSITGGNCAECYDTRVWGIELGKEPTAGSPGDVSHLIITQNTFDIQNGCDVFLNRGGTLDPTTMVSGNIANGQQPFSCGEPGAFPAQNLGNNTINNLRDF